jgi:hypothetical protein
MNFYIFSRKTVLIYSIDYSFIGDKMGPIERTVWPERGGWALFLAVGEVDLYRFEGPISRFLRVSRYSIYPAFRPCLFVGRRVPGRSRSGRLGFLATGR